MYLIVNAIFSYELWSSGLIHLRNSSLQSECAQVRFAVLSQGAHPFHRLILWASCTVVPGWAPASPVWWCPSPGDALTARSAAAAWPAPLGSFSEFPGGQGAYHTPPISYRGKADRGAVRSKPGHRKEVGKKNKRDLGATGDVILWNLF